MTRHRFLSQNFRWYLNLVALCEFSSVVERHGMYRLVRGRQKGTLCFTVTYRVLRFFLYNNCAFCAHHFVLSRDWTACSRVMLMVDREDGGHDRVSVFGDSPATRTRDFGYEAMRVE